MRIIGPIALLLTVVVLTTGCKDAASGSATSGRNTPADPNATEPSSPQPKLQTIKLWIGAEEMVAELALTIPQIRTGMMWRTNMAENEGMLFVFSIPHRAGFWMKNTPLPLSAAYIDGQGKILEIHDLQSWNTNTVLAASENVHYVLETRQGWFARHNIHPGTIIRTERGTLRDAFFQQR